MPPPPTAVILAAGSGSRLLPYTLHSPKCLTPIAGHPILRYQLAALRLCGIRDIVIVVGYLADRVRDFVDPSVTIVENHDYASTNSSYSLWLARHHIRHGFIHLNSDLLFEPAVLRALLNAADENGVIVDRDVRPGSDMMKAEMHGARIVRMAKRLTTGASAEVVGPARFGPGGAEALIDRLGHLVRSGERNRWAYSVFGELAEDLSFTGVENPGAFWAEVDTVADADDATRRMPPSMVRLAQAAMPAPARSISSESPVQASRPTHAS
jgi:choline kinase